ncbi:MAG: hypothetical protein PHX21_10385 [bacterium]|nr:hypothetical protein [bacterium]
MTIQAEYVIDKKGQKKSVVLPIKNYLKLVEYLEDLEDALDLKRAKDSVKGFIDIECLEKQIKRHKKA